MSPLNPSLARLFSFVAFAHLVAAWNTFTVPHSPGKDDTPAILAALPDFATNSTILFQESITYNIFTPIKFPILNNVDIRIEGNLTYPTDISTIQGRPASKFLVHQCWYSPLDLLAIVGDSVSCSLYSSSFRFPNGIVKSFPGSWWYFSPTCWRELLADQGYM